MPRSTWLLSLVLLGWSTNTSDAQTKIHSYPASGYRFLGVYGGGDDRCFDYHLGKLSLGDTFPDKAAWWAGVKESRAGKDNPHCHDVLTVYCGERDADLETAKQRLDAWLASEKDCPTYPELIPAICLGEENVGSRVEVLEGLARHVREKYGIPVFQWFSDPLTPDPNLTADGWIWDSYGYDPVSFRKHLMKFVALGKPAICVPWATDPHWPQWTQYPTTAALINREWRDHGFWVGMKGGFATSTHLVQRIASPQPLKQLVVTADCSANGPDLGGSITLSVGPRGEKPKWDVQTQGVHNGPLKLEVPADELGPLQDFDVHVTLHSSSGVENGDKACATLSGLSIQAKGE